jgi:hypothetical protein
MGVATILTRQKQIDLIIREGLKRNPPAKQGGKLAYLQDMEDDDYVVLGTKSTGKPTAAGTYVKTKRIAPKNFQEDFMARRGYVPMWIRMKNHILTELRITRGMIKQTYYFCFLKDIHEPLPKPDFSDAERFNNKIANYVFDNFFPQHRKKFEAQLHAEFNRQLEILRREREALWENALKTAAILYKDINKIVLQYSVICPSMYQSLPFYFMDKEVPRIIKSFEDGEIDLEEFKGKEFSQDDIDEAYVMAEAQKEQNYA